jgi:EAL domain-containing protein (putative c-di-GMP-specific phosphodiesterase class I)
MKKAKTLWLVTVIALVVVSLLFAAYIIIGYFKGFNPLALIIASMSYVLLAYLFSMLLSFLFKLKGQGEERREENMRDFGVDSYFDSRISFTRKIRKFADKNSISQQVVNKAKESEIAQKIKEKAEGNENGQKIIDAKMKAQEKMANGAIIAFSVFSEQEKYQYYQLENIKKFYGVIIRYLEELMGLKENKRKLFCGYESHTFYIYYAFSDDKELEEFLTKLESDLYTLFGKSEVRVNMHPCFGIYIIDGKAKDIYQMIDNALLSLRFSINSFQVFVYYDSKLTDESVHNDVLEAEIKRGIENKEFKVFYQGKFDLTTQKFIGAEALIRWQHPEKGLFNPAAFIGECEKSGLIHVLDFYVFDQVCKDLGDWKKRGRRMMPVSVNFSSYDFYRPDFVQSLVETIEANGIASNFIEVEITESSTANNYFYVMSVLKQLKDLNIRILMDDFGTGFSSLGNLKKYPISALKIDKSFIDEMQDDVKSKEIVQTIVSLSRSLGLQSIAEGVHTEGQVEMLKEMKCSVIQGYYYCKPMTKKDFEVFLSTNQFEKKGMLL